MSGLCAATNVARITALPDQGSPADQRPHVDENLWITFEAFTVEHSILSPAVGYRLSAGHVYIFYARDLIFIHERGAALKGVQIYIGDGATVTRSFIRKRGSALIGHSPVRTQLTWCQKEGVPRAIITHCGSEIVTGDERGIPAKQL